MSAPTPRITVFIPAHNAMPHLAHTVASIQTQTHGEFQVLILNDGSTDGTGEYLDSIRDPRFTIVHQSNRGLAATANRGFDLIRSEFVLRVDADDVLLAESLSRKLAFLEAHPDVAVVSSRTAYVYRANRRFAPGMGRRRFSPCFMPPMARPPFWDPRSDGQTISHSGVLMRMEAVRPLGGYRPLVPAEDLDLWYRLADSGHRLACLPDVLTLIRILNTSVSGTGLVLQSHYTDYVIQCHRSRACGQPEPSLEAFRRENPMTHAQLRQAAFRGNVRRAMGTMLEGRWIRGVTMLAAVAALHPVCLARKIQSRSGRAETGSTGTRPSSRGSGLRQLEGTGTPALQ